MMILILQVVARQELLVAQLPEQVAVVRQRLLWPPEVQETGGRHPARVHRPLHRTHTQRVLQEGDCLPLLRSPLLQRAMLTPLLSIKGIVNYSCVLKKRAGSNKRAVWILAMLAL